MADDLVFAHDEVDVGFGLHVERRGAEDGEWSQVKVSPEVTLLPKTWLAEVAQRSVENARHCGPSPSGSATRFWLEKLTAGSP